MFLRLATIFFLLGILVNNISAQQKPIRFDFLVASTHLPSNTVNSIAQDKQGYLWLATNNGLVRFDGYSFYTIKHGKDKENTLPNSLIHYVAIDKSNNIWIATNGGVNKYNTSTEEITTFRKDYSPKNINGTINSDIVNKIFVDSFNRVWIATFQGLNCINQSTNSISSFLNDPNNPNSISSNSITSIFEDNKNQIWVSTSYGLNFFDEKNNTFKKYYHLDDVPNSLNNNRIIDLTQTNDGTLWVFTATGLNKYNSATDSFSGYPTPPAGDGMLARNYGKIVADYLGNIWIPSNKGLFCFNPKNENFALYYRDDPAKSNLADEVLKEVFFDSENRLWVSVLDKGLQVFDPYAKRFIPSSKELLDQCNFFNGSSISAILEDSLKRLWVGTEKGLVVYNTDKINNALKEKLKGLGDIRVRSLFESSSGLIWIGLTQKLIVYDTKKEKFVTDELNLPNEIRSISAQVFLENSKGQIWIGSFGNGLYKFNPSNNTFTVYQKEDKNPDGKISSNRILSLSEDKKGNLWVATRNGINYYDSSSNTFTVYKHDPLDPKTISSNGVNSVYLDEANNILWLATEQGLNKLNLLSKTFLRINQTNSNLPNDFIYGILADNQGDLWLSTNGGITKYDPKKEIFYNYDEMDGLQNNEFNYCSYFKGKMGELFFGGVKGLNRFYPEEIKNNPYLPKVVITSIKVSDGFSKPFLEKFSIPTNYYLELPYNFNYLYFTFSALSFTHPEKNKFKYKLEGHEQEWVEVDSNQRSARYKLPPGDYTFQVIASNNDGIWDEVGQSIKIRVFPPWWQTSWAYFLYFLATSATLYGGHRYHLRRLEKRNQELEIKVKERTKEINKKNRELQDKNQELAKNYENLLFLNKKANRIFAALSEALPGTTLDNKYRLEEKIGAGGFGAVYKATHLNIKKEVAIKVFSPSPGNDSVENLERFQQEAISTCRVNHPNAVAVLDSGISSDGIPYLVMEMLQGHTLKVELKNKGRLKLERSAEIVIPICKVLAKAHSSGLIHRDIKPDNIFLHNNAEGEVVKVLDFGIAKLINPTESARNELVETEGLIGTPLYMAPERLELGPYDFQSDIYSLGSVIYEILCGEAPFQKHASSLPTIVLAQISELPIPLKTYIPDIPDKIDKIILATLEKDPSNRPSLTEIAQAFAKAAGIEYKIQPNIVEKQPVHFFPGNIVDQSTIIIVNKTQSDTDEIRPSEQITLIKPIEK